MFLAMTVFLALESDGFTAGMGANIPGKKRSELKVRDTWFTRKSVKTLSFPWWLINIDLVYVIFFLLLIRTGFFFSRLYWVILLDLYQF